MEKFKEPLSLAEETEYVERYKMGDAQAKIVLIEHNLRLVAHIVKKFNKQEQDIEDMISIGTIGLIKAIDTFKNDKGNKLATYASRCIENELLMYFRAEKKKSREISLNEPIGTDKDGNEISLVDIIEYNDEDFATKYDSNSDLRWIRQNIDKVLDEREAYIIRKRYGLMGGGEMAQRTLAKELNISRSYVSRIEKKALLKLKEALLTKE